MEFFNKIKSKLQFFIIGLMAGLIVAGGFFLFKLDDYFKELRAYKNSVREQQNTTNETQQENKESTKKNKSKKEKVTSKKNSNNDDNEPASDSLSLRKEAVSTIPPTDSSMLTSIETKDTLLVNVSNNSENVIVRKDELIASKLIEIQNLNLIAKNTEDKKDSLLQKISGIREDVPKTAYRVEIWSSPLNYKGYKMTKSKIILYGVVNYESMKLYQLDDNFYIKTSLSTFVIEYSSEFRPLEKVTDESILVKLR